MFTPKQTDDSVDPVPDSIFDVYSDRVNGMLCGCLIFVLAVLAVIAAILIWRL